MVQNGQEKFRKWSENARKGEQKVLQVNSRKWNISATNEQQWNPFFASEAFLECEEKRTVTGHVFLGFLDAIASPSSYPCL